MSYQSVWYHTRMPGELLDVLEKDLKNYDSSLVDSRIAGEVINRQKRNSKNSWVDSKHWISGVVWHYIHQANQSNFLFDITSIDANSLQYTQYREGEFYGWHHDAWLEAMYTPKASAKGGLDVDSQVSDWANVSVESVRKLSFILQLSSHDDYEGGNVQLLDDTGTPYFLPRERGTIIVFDSRTQHRVLKVTKGLRKSLVGWAVGPRWK